MSFYVWGLDFQDVEIDSSNEEVAEQKDGNPERAKWIRHNFEIECNNT